MRRLNTFHFEHPSVFTGIKSHNVMMLLDERLETILSNRSFVMVEQMMTEPNEEILDFIRGETYRALWDVSRSERVKEDAITN